MRVEPLFINLVILPLIAVVFSLLNFGLTLFSPLLAEINQASLLAIDSFYATQQQTLSFFMGVVGTTTTTLCLLLLIQLTQRSSRLDVALSHSTG